MLALRQILPPAPARALQELTAVNVRQGTTGQIAKNVLRTVVVMDTALMVCKGTEAVYAILDLLARPVITVHLV